MRGKAIIGRIIGGIVLLLLFVGIQYGGGNPLFLWYFRSLYSIEKATIEERLLPSGEMEVHETIHYKMRKPFRGLFREITPERYVTFHGVNLWTEKIETQKVEFLSLDEGGFSARVWLVPYGSNIRLNPQEYPEVILHVEYVVRGVVENGPEIAQLFRQFWGQWDAPAKEVQGIFIFPESLEVQAVYPHPATKVEREGNRITLTARRLPPQAFAEARFLFAPQKNMPYAVENPTLLKSEIQSIEEEYSRSVRKDILMWVIILLVSGGIFALLFLLGGREPRIAYQGIYERELPYDDPPDLVNGIVKNLGGRVDADGMSAVLLRFYQLGLIEFQEAGEKKGIVLKTQATPPHLSPSEREFLTLLTQFSSDGVFDFAELRKKIESSLAKARFFNTALSRYQQNVFQTMRKRRYFRFGVNIVAKFFALLMMLFPIGVLGALSLQSAHLVPFLTIVSALLFFGGGAILMLPKTVFGRFTSQGLEYTRKWQNFARFLSDFSLLSQKPPESIVLWEHYLIYATALGIADTVRYHLQRLVPQEVWERESTHRSFYTPFPYFLGREIVGVHQAAMASVTRSTSTKGGSFRGGFSGGGGGVGRGSGGGRGGAF